MRTLFILFVATLVFAGITGSAQETPRKEQIIIDAERYMPRGVPIEEPFPLDRTLKLTLKLSAPDGTKEIVLLCATSAYGAEIKDVFGIGGTLRMIRNTEVLITFNFDAINEKMSFSGNGSIKIRLGDEKVVYKYGDYSVAVKVEPEE